jgi:2,3-bisphosphoglycerate-dependent phosphoglycerate mutase
MVRHGDSPKNGHERKRGLTEKGRLDAQRVADLLKGEMIDVVISSPYDRSILTVQPFAKQIGQEIFVYEDLKERIFSAEETRITDKELASLLRTSFSDPHFSLVGGESNAECQTRAIKVLKELLTVYQSKKVVIGTHGAVMILMMKYYDDDYGLEFLLQTSKPDVYRMEFDGPRMIGVKRLS